MAARNCAEAAVSDTVSLAVVTLLLFAYLLYALLVPERF
jgi:K+-transporting ATPase KdpF subunit